MHASFLSLTRSIINDLTGWLSTCQAKATVNCGDHSLTANSRIESEWMEKKPEITKIRVKYLSSGDRITLETY